MHRPRLVPPWGGCPWWTSGPPLRLAPPPTQRPVAGITGRMWPLGASSSSSDRRSLLQPARDPGGQCGRGGRSILRSPGARAQRPVPPPLSLSTPSTPSCSGPSRACPARWPTRPPSPPEASRPGGRRRVRADPHPRVVHVRAPTRSRGDSGREGQRGLTRSGPRGPEKLQALSALARQHGPLRRQEASARAEIKVAAVCFPRAPVGVFVWGPNPWVSGARRGRRAGQRGTHRSGEAPVSRSPQGDLAPLVLERALWPPPRPSPPSPASVPPRPTASCPAPPKGHARSARGLCTAPAAWSPSLALLSAFSSLSAQLPGHLLVHALTQSFLQETFTADLGPRICRVPWGDIRLGGQVTHRRTVASCRVRNYEAGGRTGRRAEYAGRPAGRGGQCCPSLSPRSQPLL